MPFFCSICGEESTRICARCTKDSCNNHLCEKCLRCSDCCECEITLADNHHGVPVNSARAAMHAEAPPPNPEPQPVPPHPSPDPDPDPEPLPEEPAEADASPREWPGE